MLVRTVVVPPTLGGASASHVHEDEASEHGVYGFGAQTLPWYNPNNPGISRGDWDLGFVELFLIWENKPPDRMSLVSGAMKGIMDHGSWDEPPRW